MQKFAFAAVTVAVMACIWLFVSRNGVSLPDDPLDLAVLALMVVAGPFIIWWMLRNLASGFLPAYRARLPKAGKLTKILSPHLQQFVACLPRPAGDVLAGTCQPIAAGTLPYFEGHGYVNAAFPLWKAGGKYSLAVRSSARRRKERTDFVWSGETGEDWDIRACTEQGFLADTMVDVMKTLDWSQSLSAREEARRAADALGFKHLDETVKWFERWSAHDWSKPFEAPEEDDDEEEDATPAGRAETARFAFVSGIDERASS